MNSFFTSVGPDLAQKHKDRWEYFGSTEYQSMEDITTDTDEVILLCREIEILKSSGMDEISIKCGVPQGSVLGPLLFLVFINDLQGSLSNCKVKLYADDSVLYHSGVNVKETARFLQTSLDELRHWCKVNKLTVNTKKSKLMVFGTRAKVKKAKDVRVFLNGDKLQKVPTFKYLGIIVDPTLNFNHHISFVVRTVLHKMTLLAKVKKYLNNEVALQIYKSTNLYQYTNIQIHYLDPYLD